MKCYKTKWYLGKIAEKIFEFEEVFKTKKQANECVKNDLIVMKGEEILKAKLKINDKYEYIREAEDIYELQYSLENISQDDDKNIKDYTVKEVVAEARYVLSCYLEGGHSLNEDLNDGDKSVRREALKEVKKLKSYISKHSKIK